MQILPIDSSVRVESDELFFSVTNSNGIIRYGNSVFCRVAGYPLERLLNRPHNLVRHPEMPRALFRLMWEYLQSNRIFAGYVKNLSSSGEYYWVYATVAPCSGGYISIRQKPCSKHLEVVKPIYKGTLNEEKAELRKGSSIENSVNVSMSYLRSAIQTLGYSTFDQFMMETLSDEVLSRDALLSKEHTGVALHLQESRNGKKLGSKAITQDSHAQDLLDTHSKLASISSQLGVLAIHDSSFHVLRNELKEFNVPITRWCEDLKVASIALSQSFPAIERETSPVTLSINELSSLSDVLLEQTAEFESILWTLRELMNEMLFLVSLSKQNIEMSSLFARELLLDSLSYHRNLQLLRLVENSNTLTDQVCAELLQEHFGEVAKECLPLFGRLTCSFNQTETKLSEFRQQLRIVEYAAKVTQSHFQKCTMADQLNSIVTPLLRSAKTIDAKLQKLNHLVHDSRVEVSALSTFLRTSIETVTAKANSEQAVILLA
jgi:aerotaxis receptor